MKILILICITTFSISSFSQDRKVNCYAPGEGISDHNYSCLKNVLYTKIMNETSSNNRKRFLKALKRVKFFREGTLPNCQRSATAAYVETKGRNKNNTIFYCKQRLYITKHNLRNGMSYEEDYQYGFEILFMNIIVHEVLHNLKQKHGREMYLMHDDLIRGVIPNTFLADDHTKFSEFFKGYLEGF